MPTDLTLARDPGAAPAARPAIPAPRGAGFRWTPVRGLIVAVLSSAVVWIGLGYLLMRLP